MKLTTGILVLGMAVATAWGQNPDVIQDTRDTMKALQQKKQLDSNSALQGIAQPAAAQRDNGNAAPGSSQNPATTTTTAKTGKSAASASSSAKTGKRAAKPKVVAASKPSPRKQKVAVEGTKSAAESNGERVKPINVAGRRDPFVSPVVNQTMVGSGCSTGKRCLAIDQIALKGVVKSDVGMIAVVVNSLDKAYFLRENDPVFNGYVVRITGDSIVFKETVQDKLGKPFTREVTKKITTPAV